MYETLDKQDIEARLSMMVPSNMYVIWHSLSHKEAATQQEKWYSKEFSVHMLTDDQINMLENTKSEFKMGNAPPNVFMPRKIEISKGEKSGKPKLVLNKDNV